MLNVIIFGAPGSGKGLQSKKLAADPTFKKSSGLIHISTGDLLREEMNKHSILGDQIAENMNRGEYVSDAFASQILMNKVHELGGYKVDGFIFDGFPRTLPQCSFLDRVLASFKAEVNVVINLQVDSKTLIERLIERSKTTGRTDSLTEKDAKNRLKIFALETLPILEYWKDIVTNIDGTATPDEVYKSIFNVLKDKVI